MCPFVCLYLGKTVEVHYYKDCMKNSDVTQIPITSNNQCEIWIWASWRELQFKCLEPTLKLDCHVWILGDTAINLHTRGGGYFAQLLSNLELKIISPDQMFIFIGGGWYFSQFMSNLKLKVLSPDQIYMGKGAGGRALPGQNRVLWPKWAKNFHSLASSWSLIVSHTPHVWRRLISWNFVQIDIEKEQQCMAI